MSLVSAAAGIFSTTSQALTLNGSVEQQIGNPTYSYVDPEYSSDSMRTVFVDASNRIWEANMDPTTGHMVPADGRGTQLGTGITYTAALNGPEFGYSALGEAVVWTGNDANGFHHCFLSRGGVATQLDSGNFDVVAALPSQNTASASQLVLGKRTVRGVSDWVWFSEASPGTLRSFPVAAASASGPRWFLNQETIITSMTDANNVVQIALYDTASGTVKQVTTDAGNKADANSYMSPESGNRPTIVTTITELDGSMTVAFYVRTGTTWVRSTTTLTTTGTIKTPKPFVYSGNSYVVYAQFINANALKILIRGLDGSTIVASNTTLQRRTDPETYFLNGELYVSYFEYSTTPSVPTSLFLTSYSP